MSERKILFPGESGAWLIILTSFFIGWLAAPDPLTLKPLLILLAGAGAYCSLYPVQIIIKKRSLPIKIISLKKEWMWLLIYGIPTFAVSVPLFVVLKWWDLFFFINFATIALAIHLYNTTVMRRRRLAADFLGTMALTTLAAASYYAAMDGLMVTSVWMVWILVTLYFGGSIVYVKRKIMIYGEEARCRNIIDNMWYMKTPLVFHFAVIIGLVFTSLIKLTPAWTLIAFLPGVAKVLWGTWEIGRKSVTPRQVTKIETIVSIVSGILLVIAIRLG